MVTRPAGPEPNDCRRSLAEIYSKLKSKQNFGRNRFENRHRCDDSIEIDQWFSNYGLRTLRIPRDYFRLPTMLEEKNIVLSILMFYKICSGIMACQILGSKFHTDIHYSYVLVTR
jgi:hypothetical protein